MTDEKPGKIEQRAYEIWDREGRPHGKALEHWQRAVAEIAREEEQAAKARKKEPKAKQVASKPTAAAKSSGAKPAAKTKSAAKPKKAATKTKR